MSCFSTSSTYLSRAIKRPNTLELTFTINKVSKSLDSYLVSMTVSFRNATAHPLILRRNLVTADKGGGIYVNLRKGDDVLFQFFTASDIIEYMDTDSFIMLEAKDTLDIELDATISSHVIRADDASKVDISQGTYIVFLSYSNHSIGYQIPSTPNSTASQPSAPLIADMNAWVGKIESNPVEVEFP